MQACEQQWAAQQSGVGLSVKARAPWFTQCISALVAMQCGVAAVHIWVGVLSRLMHQIKRIAHAAHAQAGCASLAGCCLGSAHWSTAGVGRPALSGPTD